MTTFHNFTLKINTGGARRELKPNGTCLIRCKQITITWGKCHNQWKVDLEKNGFEVSQNNILYVFGYKVLYLFGVKRPLGVKKATMEQVIVAE